MALSFLHRVSGCALSVGMLLLIYWVVALASGRQAYADAQVFFAHGLVRFALVVFSFAFFYHLLNGVRHLAWDSGHGFERKTARTSGWIAFVGGIALTAFFWFLILNRATGGAA
jgi:succinate dehydrogenase / fumarate reductase, cytochrome b subunit